MKTSLKPKDVKEPALKDQRLDEYRAATGKTDGEK